MAKFLIVGLGNIGDEYAGTRHNIGFMMIDAFAASKDVKWEDKRYGFVAKCRVKNAELVLLKPSTYMNLSGNAVRYWLAQEKIPVEYTRGTQINFVLGEWTDEEKKQIDERLKVTSEIIPSFCLQGIDRTMNQFNGK